MPAHVGRIADSTVGRAQWLFLLLATSAALATVDASSLKKEAAATTAPPSVQTSPSALPDESSSIAPALVQPPSPRSAHPVAALVPDEGRKNSKRKSTNKKKKSPNHALLTRFGLSRWKEEEARRGAAVTSDSWSDGEVSPRIPVKVKKGGGGKRRSSEEGESAMYYVRLPPSHHYYSPFLHGTADAEDLGQTLEPTSRDNHGYELGMGVVDGASDDDHVVRIEPLPPPRHDHHGASSIHHSQHRHHAVRRLPLSFLSNGKPGPVYHWNLPIIRGEEQIKRGWKKVYNDGKPLKVPDEAVTPTTVSPAHPSMTASTRLPHIESDVFHVVKTVRGRVHPMAVPPVRSRITGNRKPYHRRPLSSQPATSFPISSYYSRKGDKNESLAARSSTQQAAMQKSFQGNGKPHGFYVINGSKKYYHRLLP